MKRAIALLAAIAIAIPVLVALEGNVPGITYRGASPLNKYWDGTSILSEYLSGLGGEVFLVTNWRELGIASLNIGDNGTCGVVLIVSPEKPYSRDELAVIRSIVLDRGFNLVLLDEGTYGNDVLKAVETPVVVNSFDYIRDEYGSAMVTGSLNAGNYWFNLTLAYTSSIKILRNDTCVVKGLVDNISIGALCVLKTGSKVFVLGDGSVVTNAALTPTVEYNPYVVFTETLFLNELCRGKGDLLVLIDASKYRLRTLDLAEVFASNATYVEVVATVINPARYVLRFLVEIDEQYGHGLFIALALMFLTTMLIYGKRKNVKELGREQSFSTTGYYLSSAILSLRNLCVKRGVCFEELKCLVSRRLSDKCRKRVYEVITRNTEIRRKLVSILFYELYGEKIADIYEVLH